MSFDFFRSQIAQMQWRLHHLYECAAQKDVSSTNLLGMAFKELAIASEELQVMIEELDRQSENMQNMEASLREERQRYRELFDFAPNAYLVTDLDGKIIQANRCATALLNISQKFLMGKVLSNFIVEQDRWTFRSELTRQRHKDRVQVLELLIEPRGGEQFPARLTIDPMFDIENNLIGLRWMLQDISEQKQALKTLEITDSDLRRDRAWHIYTRGEIISLHSQSMWLVDRGIVKLSTIADNGQEVLVGLAGPGMVFGSTLTALHIYQASALSKEVHIASISLVEIANSPQLAQTLLPKISHRLKQAESLLAITGQKGVKNRLLHLLLWLKQELGQPMTDGTRLSVRFTHEDLANACCTTRVTITRLLSKLQKQGKISFDSKSHLILINIDFDDLDELSA